VNGLTTTANTGSRILLGANETLTLGALTSAGAGSSLNFDTAAGGANATTPAIGTGLVILTGQTAGNAINSGFTVSDAGGFGLATVNGSNQVIRMTTTTLLPATGASSGLDYRVDNNGGGGGAAGSSTLAVTGSEAAKSITVDTTTASGTLTLNSDVVLSNNTWNFGGTGSNTYQITGNAGVAGLQSVASNDTISLNNYNAGVVTISSPILANGTNAVNVNGTGTTVLAGANTYTGATKVSGGTLRVNGSTSSSSAVTVASGATLGGTGTIGGATTIYGIHDPGNSPGIETFSGDLTYNGATVEWELIGNTEDEPGVKFDRIYVGRDLDFASATVLNLKFNSTGSTVDWSDPFWDMWSIHEWQIWGVTGNTTNLGNLSLSSAANWQDKNSLAFSAAVGNQVPSTANFYLFVDNDSVYLRYEAMPEPASWSVLGLALGLATMGARRRRRL
jgi:autotransporter-associated beta strand protein